MGGGGGGGGGEGGKGTLVYTFVSVQRCSRTQSVIHRARFRLGHHLHIIPQSQRF